MVISCQFPKTIGFVSLYTFVLCISILISCIRIDTTVRITKKDLHVYIDKTLFDI